MRKKDDEATCMMFGSIYPLWLDELEGNVSLWQKICRNEFSDG